MCKTPPTLGFYLSAYHFLRSIYVRFRTDRLVRTEYLDLSFLARLRVAPAGTVSISPYLAAHVQSIVEVLHAKFPRHAERRSRIVRARL